MPAATFLDGFFSRDMVDLGHIEQVFRNILRQKFLELAYATKLIRRICRNKSAAVQALGAKNAAFLHQRLADIEALKNGAELQLLPELFHINHSTGCINSSMEDVLILEAEHGHGTAPLDSYGVFQWDEVTRLKITSVGIK